MNSNLGKIAWLTGAKGGIGSDISTRLSSLGWNVIELNREVVDLSDKNSVLNWVKNYDLQTPDLIICNAGGNEPRNISDLQSENYRFWLENNFLGHVEIVQSVIEDMASKGTGSIIFISSTYANRSRIGRSQYSVSKAAQDAYMRSLALEYAPRGLKINSVSPGFVRTPLTAKNNDENALRMLVDKIPMGRLAEPSEITNLILFLSSDENSYITGQNVAIDGGFSLT